MISWLENLYRRLWTAVGGRPWTEIVRKDQKRSPLVFLVVFLGLGILVGKLAGKYGGRYCSVFCWEYCAVTSGGENRGRKLC